MNDTLKNKFISLMREATPKGQSTAKTISNILGINKEYVYRRLRGEINFSFVEISKIAQSMGFSIDMAIGAVQKRNTLFELHLLYDNNLFTTLVKKLQDNMNTMHKFKEQQADIKVRMACNTLATYDIFKHKHLSKFYIYKWYCQALKGFPDQSLSEFHIPKELEKLISDYIVEIHQLPHLTLILDPNVYESSSLDINYFHKLGLISKVDVLNLKADLLDSVDILEKLATEGRSSPEDKAIIDIFISTVDIETSYDHIEINDDSITSFPLYSIYSLDSKDKVLSNIQRDWIDSLKKQSISISQNGEIERFKYLNKQRKTIEKLIPIE